MKIQWQIVYRSRAEERRIKKIKADLTRMCRDAFRVLLVICMLVSGVTAMICAAAIDSVQDYQTCLGILIWAIAFFGICAGFWSELK